MKKIISLILIFSFLTFNSCFVGVSLAEPAAAAYLCELGTTFYAQGRYDEAISEFSKVLMLDPSNKIAQRYINEIFKSEAPEDGLEEFSRQAVRKERPIKASPHKSHPKRIKEKTLPEYFDRGDLISSTLDNLSSESVDAGNDQGANYAQNSFQASDKKQSPVDKNNSDIFSQEKNEKPPIEIGGLQVKGEVQASVGFAPDETIWKRANADLSEKNFRMLSTTAYDRRTNTYNPGIYDSVKVNLDTAQETGFNFHTNLAVDPWSFTGKTSKFTVLSDWGDAAEVQLKYWASTGYTVNEAVYSSRFGNTFNLPEAKLRGDAVDAMALRGAFRNEWGLSDIFRIPESKIEMQFQPVRELWFDYTQEGAKFRLFPLAYQNQAFTTDDPLGLSNHYIWWQGSPWINRWVPGRLNEYVSPNDFTKGRYDDSLSALVRDSTGTRLTALRGFSFEVNSDDRLYIASTFASPKTLWQDYTNFDNVIDATRIKYRVMDNLSVGSTFTYRLGLNENNEKDASNFIWGTDLGFAPIEGMKATAEIAGSNSLYDIVAKQYTTKSSGNAYQIGLMGTYPQKNIMDMKFGYADIKPEESDSLFAKYKFFAARMDAGFDPVLSNYRGTRNDAFWSRHLHFRKPFTSYYAGLDSPALSWDDIAPNAIGDGIDVGRQVLGFRLETLLLDLNLDNLFDVRNVHEANSNKFIENVARDEITFKATEKLTIKGLGIYQVMPKTHAGLDPFIVDQKTDEYLANAAIIDGLDPTLKTGSLGAEYKVLDNVAISQTWEHTNDSTLAYDNYPRGVLNSGTMATYRAYDKIYRIPNSFLYSQGLFPLPPYEFFNIYKTGLRFNASESLEFYLDYTRNEFKSAGQIDDNINHVGLEINYSPTKKFGLMMKYTYSRWNDINRMLDGQEKIYLGHHNFYSEFRYMPGLDDEFVLQYGEGGRSPLAVTSFDPYGGSISTLDTRHIIRMYYRRKF